MPIPPLEFLLNASKRSLEDAELVELNRSSNFAKALRVEMDAWVEACAAAMVTRWMMDNREALLSRREVRAEPKKATKLFREGETKSA